MPEKSFASPRASSRQSAVHAPGPATAARHDQLSPPLPPRATEALMQQDGRPLRRAAWAMPEKSFATPRHRNPYAAGRPARYGRCRKSFASPRASSRQDAVHAPGPATAARRDQLSPPSPPRATETLMQQDGPPAAPRRVGNAGKILCHPAPRRPLCSKTAARYGRCRKSFASPRASSRQSAVHAPNPRRPPPGAINYRPLRHPAPRRPLCSKTAARCAAQPPGAAVLGNLTGPLSAANRTGPSPGFSQKNRAVAFRLRSCLFSYTAPTYSSSVMS